MNFSQGNLPSCQTLSALGTLWKNPAGRKQIEKMISRVGDSYEITFPGRPNQPVTVAAEEYVQNARDRAWNDSSGDAGAIAGAGVTAGSSVGVSGSVSTSASTSDLGYRWRPLGARGSHVSGDELMRVMEVAYAKFQKLVHAEKFAGTPDDKPLRIFKSKNFHYQADESLRDLTGWTVNTLAAGESTSDSSRSYADCFGEKPHLHSTLIAKLKELADNPQDHVATACTMGQPGSGEYLDPGSKIHPWHDHIIAAVDVEAQTINVIDPYNSRITMILHWQDFFQYFYLVADARISEQR